MALPLRGWTLLRAGGHNAALACKKARALDNPRLEYRQPEACLAHAVLFYLSASSLRICTRRILPLTVLGNSSTNSTTRGYL